MLTLAPLSKGAAAMNSGVCEAIFKKMSSSDVPRWKSAADDIGRRTSTQVQFKETPVSGQVELGVRFCGNQSDVRTAIDLLKKTS